MVEDAADIATLGAALGYKAVDLYGNSYGSIVTLQAMRDHPQGIRAVVLDGILTPKFGQSTDLIPNAWRALQQIFTACAASPSCNARYPHLAQTFTQLLSQLQAHPASIHIYSSVQKAYETGTLTGVGLWTGLATYLMDSNVQPFAPQPTLAPRLITNMARGDFSVVAQYLETIHWDQPSTQNGLMATSMECSFNQLGNLPARIAASAKMLPASIRSGVVAYYAGSVTACAAWGVPGNAAVNHTYFRSSIPTLLLSRRYDPVGLPAQTRALANTLGHAHLVPVPSGHHPIDVVILAGAVGGSATVAAVTTLRSPHAEPVLG